MLVAITGATGFVGRHLVELHRQRGDVIRILKRPGTVRIQPPLGVEAIEADISTVSEHLERFVSGADILYHCAAEIRNERLMEATNICGTENLARIAATRVRHWVQTSSVAVYGTAEAGVITEDSPLRPVTLYGKTKLQAEEIVCAASSAGAFTATILRPSNIFGIGMPSNALFKLFGMIDRGWFFFVGKPGATMNYVYVDNVAAALVLCGTHPAAPGRAYNLSDEMPIEQFAAIIGDELGARCPSRRLPEPPLRILASLLGSVPGMPLTPDRLNALSARASYSSAKIRRELAHNSLVPLETGLRQLVRAWKAARTHVSR